MSYKSLKSYRVSSIDGRSMVVWAYSRDEARASFKRMTGKVPVKVVYSHG